MSVVRVEMRSRDSTTCHSITAAVAAKARTKYRAPRTRKPTSDGVPIIFRRVQERGRPRGQREKSERGEKEREREIEREGKR